MRQQESAVGVRVVFVSWEKSPIFLIQRKIVLTRLAELELNKVRDFVVGLKTYSGVLVVIMVVAYLNVGVVFYKVIIGHEKHAVVGVDVVQFSF